LATHTPVALLTGFLGSGKTTLLSGALSRREFSRTAVIINEFGEVSIDHLVVADLAENIVELRDGCLCCTIRGDLVMTLRDLHHKRVLEDIPSFDRVVVETSGLADPIPLIHTLMANPPLQKVFALDAVVCVADGEHGGRCLREHRSAATQVAMADVLVVSKVDSVARTDVDALIERLREINQGAEIIEVVRGNIDPARLFGRSLFQPGRGAGQIGPWLAGAHPDSDHGAQYTSHVIRHVAPLSLAGTSVFLNRVVNELSQNILRIKGLAGFREKGGRPALLHGVQNKFYPVEWLDEWPDGDTTSRLIFIGRDLDTARIDELFGSLCV
jgi:G3E family GTPase